MKDTIEEEVADNYLEHGFHDNYDEHCSSCFIENLIIRSRRPCLARNCKGNGINTTEATYCTACHAFAEGYNAGI